MSTHVGEKIFQNTPRRVAKFRENRPRDVEKSMVGKKIKHGQNITVFAIAIAIADDCNNYMKWKSKASFDCFLSR